MKTVFLQALVLLLLAVPGAVVSGWLHPKAPSWTENERPGPGEVTLQTALSWESVLWVDARSRADYEAGRIPGALLLNEEEWDDLFLPFIDRWNPDQPVVVYCGGSRCQLSEKVAERLRADLGTEEVYVLKGGWNEWLQTDGEVAR